MSLASMKPRLSTDKQLASVADRPEIHSLTGLRFLAALSVALSHTVIAFGCDPHYWPFQLMMNTGAIGMSMFFVLSGFIMHYNYYERLRCGQGAALSSFFFARFARLYPLYLLILLCAVCWRIPAPNDIYLSIALPYYLTLTQAWFYLLVGPHSLAYAGGYFTDLTWSISTEWFFYLCLPVLVLGFARLRSARATIFAVAILTVVAFASLTFVFKMHGPLQDWATMRFGDRASDPQDGYFRWLVYLSPYFRLSEFVLGALVSHLHRALGVPTLPSRRAPAANIAATLAVLALVVLLAEMFPPVPINGASGSYPPFIQDYHRCFGFAVPVAILIFCLARYRTNWSRILSSRVFLKGGDASYSIYLLHMPLLAVFRGGSTSGLASWRDALVFAGRLTFVLTFIIIISYGVFLAYEAPARRWLRRLHDRFAGRGARPATAFVGGLVMGPSVIVFLAVLISTNASALAGRHSIRVVEATYGANCGGLQGNATVPVRRQCDALHNCDFAVRSSEIGDPAGGCAKTFSVRWRCKAAGKGYQTTLPPGTDLGAIARLSCP
jgi:peptidoglycan/LPS O-acetylase OafA/YrhL